MANDHLVLVTGASTTGKSACLRNMKNPGGVLYCNTESNKKLPFRAKFMKSKTGIGFNIVDPLTLNTVFATAETKPDVHTIVVDSVTFLMDAFVTQYIHNSSNGQQAWGDFQQFFKTLMQQHVANSTKTVIMTAHTRSDYDESLKEYITKVPIQGALKNNGIESYFSMVISTKKMRIKDLKKYISKGNKLLNVSEKEEALGFKYVFQTMITKETVYESIRGPMGMWEDDTDWDSEDNINETYIDNDIQLVIDRLKEYYGE